MTFDEVMEKLNDFTARPKDGDWDEHTQAAMKAVYDLMQAKLARHEKVLREYEDFAYAIHPAKLSDAERHEVNRLQKMSRELEHADD